MNQEATRTVCAIDLGGTNLRGANVDSHGEVHERIRIATPHYNNRNDLVAAIVSVLNQCNNGARLRGTRVERVSIVVPGSVQTGVVINAPNIRALQNFDLATALRQAIGRPVLLENDANAAALGEMWRGAARGYQTVICLTLGTGVGGGIVLDGKLWRGIDGTAGEIGHTTVEPFGGVKCGCRNEGCLEVYASATGIVRMAREGLAKYPTSTLHQTNEKELTAAGIFSAGVAGDQLSREVFERMGKYLGVAMANLVNIFNPEMIVIGGGGAGAWELFADRARSEVLQRAFPVPAKRCRIERSGCGDDAGLLGAAWVALQQAPAS